MLYATQSADGPRGRLSGLMRNKLRQVRRRRDRPLAELVPGLRRLRLADGAQNSAHEGMLAKGFLQYIPGAESAYAVEPRTLSIAGDYHNRQLRSAGRELPQHLFAIHVRHVEIQQHAGRAIVQLCVEKGSARIKATRSPAATMRQQLQRGTHCRIIVDDVQHHVRWRRGCRKQSSCGRCVHGLPRILGNRSDRSLIKRQLPCRVIDRRQSAVPAPAMDLDGTFAERQFGRDDLVGRFAHQRLQHVARGTSGDRVARQQQAAGLIGRHCFEKCGGAGISARIKPGRAQQQAQAAANTLAVVDEHRSIDDT